jgi:hypothetical protein
VLSEHWILFFHTVGGTSLMVFSRLSGRRLKPEERAALIPKGFEHELKNYTTILRASRWIPRPCWRRDSRPERAVLRHVLL